jgi:hypothetical protein
MKKAPKIGDRVSYSSDYLIEYEKEPRVCTGVVTKIYPHYNDVFDRDGEFVRRGPVLPEDQWKVAVKVDRPLPKWWAYGQETDQFCPDVAEVEPITT